MGTVKIYFSGDTDIDARLRELDSKLQRKIVVKACREALRPVLKQAKENAPKRTGRLRKSIKLRAIKRSRKRIGSNVTTGTADNAYAGRTFYGAFLEYGFRFGKRDASLRRASVQKSRALRRGNKAKAEALQVATDAADNRKRFEPLEYMKRAADANEAEAKEIFRRVCREMIQQNLPTTS